MQVNLLKAINRSVNWWYCDNVVNHKGQIGLLCMNFPQVFILIRNSEQLMCSFEEFKDNIAEVNFFEPGERETADVEQILIDAWNFLSLQEEEEERLYNESNGYEDIDI